MPPRLRPIACLTHCALIFLPVLSFAKESALNQSASPNPLVGVLEESSSQNKAQASYTFFRVLFQKVPAGEWQAFASVCKSPSCADEQAKIPAPLAWFVSAENKVLGKITTNRSLKAMPQDVGEQKITSSTKIPFVGEKSDEYAGASTQPIHRPVVATTRKPGTKSESWRLSESSKELEETIHKKFREEFPKLDNCKSPEDNKPEPWAYADEDVELSKVLRSSKNWKLVQVHIAFHCDGAPAAPYFDRWYAVPPKSEPSYLGDEMAFIDAGDFADDKKTEILFLITSTERSGYILFYDDFTKHAGFEFSVH